MTNKHITVKSDTEPFVFFLVFFLLLPILFHVLVVFQKNGETLLFCCEEMFKEQGKTKKNQNGGQS